MDSLHLLTGTRWEILQELSKAPKATSELAKILGTSQATISQQIKQLELTGYVKREKGKHQGTHYEYMIAKESMYYIHLGTRTAKKKEYRKGDIETFLAGLVLYPNWMALMSFVLNHTELFERFIAVGVLARETPQMFILAESVDDIRSHHSNVKVKTIDGELDVVLWSHTPEEVENGLNKGDVYYYDSLLAITTMYDPKGFLKEYRVRAEKRQ